MNLSAAAVIETSLDAAAQSSVRVAAITPEATEAERAAIVAAYEALWPEDHASDMAPAQPTRWRYSGRPWHHRPGYGGWA